MLFLVDLYYKKWAYPGLFSFIFVCTNKQYIFTKNKCEKCPSSIRCWDSNPRPSEHDQGSLPHETKFRIKKVLQYWSSALIFCSLVLSFFHSLISFPGFSSFYLTFIGHCFVLILFRFITILQCDQIGLFLKSLWNNFSHSDQ